MENSSDTGDPRPRARSRSLRGLLLVLALTAVACGSDDDAADGGSGAGDTATSEPGDQAADGGDVFEGDLPDGSSLRVRLDADPADPAVAPFEAFRDETGGPEVTWLVAEITVPDGTDGTGRFITFVEPGADPLDDDPSDDGDGVTNAEFACAEASSWVEGSTSEDAVASFEELLAGPCGGQTLQVLAPAGSTTTYVMVYEGDLPEFESVQAGLGTTLAPA